MHCVPMIKDTAPFYILLENTDKGKYLIPKLTMFLSSKLNMFPGLILEEAPSLDVEAYNVTTSTAVIRWQPLKKAESVVDFTGYRVSLQSERDTSRVNLVNTNVSSLLFDGLHTFTNYCVTVEPLTVLSSTRVEDCYDFVTEDDGKAA